MAAKKPKVTAQVAKGQLPEFTKEQLLGCEKYSNRRDLLNALLDDEELYTMEAVDSMIQEFYKKGRVK